MSKGWRTLTRSDLRTFDDNMTKAVLYAMDHGGVGRISSNGHAIIRNDNGQTMSVSRSAGGNRKANVANDLCRLFGAPVEDARPTVNAKPRAIAPAKSTDDEPTLTCPANHCTATFVTEGARYTHVNDNHVRCTEPGCDYVGHNKQSVTLHHTRVHKGVNPAKGRTRKRPAPTPAPTPAPKVGVNTPADNQPTVQPTVETTGNEPIWVDANERLARIRKVLGEDPRVAELQGQLKAAREAAQRLTQERDDALTQLALVKEALHL